MSLNRTPKFLGIVLAMLLLVNASVSSADPIVFNIINPTGNQSRVNLTATGTLLGGALNVEPQIAAGGLNGQGSLSTLYNGTINTDLYQTGLGLPGGGSAVAQNTRGTLANLALTPNVGGTSGTAAGNYGVRFIAPLEGIDLPAIPIEGVGEVDLGTLTAVTMNVALRNVTLGLQGTGNIPLNPASTLPQTFDASEVDVAIQGTADIALSAVLKQDNILAYFANLVIIQIGRAHV